MKYVIMADGQGNRWNNYENTPKHLVKVNGERIIERAIRLIRKYDEDASIIVTSHDERYEFDGATRYEPKNNKLEIDRFTRELIEDDVFFIYGDTFYTDDAMKKIITFNSKQNLFFGNGKSIVAIKVNDSKEFIKHINIVRDRFLKGEIPKCIGWQVYQSIENLPFGDKTIKKSFVLLEDETNDINTPEEYIKMKK